MQLYGFEDVEMNKKGTIHFKGQLKLYMQWPVVMTILLIAMNIWIYMVDQSAGFLMSIFVIIYAIIAFILYVNNRSLIFAELVEFATQYSGVQETGHVPEQIHPRAESKCVSERGKGRTEA